MMAGAAWAFDAEYTTAFDRFSPTACSYVAGTNYAGEAQMITFT